MSKSGCFAEEDAVCEIILHNLASVDDLSLEKAAYGTGWLQ